MKLKNLVLFIICSLQMGFANGQVVEKMIVFYNKEKPTITTAELEKLKELATTLEVEFHLKDINDGVPKEVTISPTIVFQNDTGRSLFYGRYSNYSRLKNFIRTARLVHQKEIENVKQDKLIWEEGRAMIVAPLKITELKGSPPKGFDKDVFHQNIDRYVDQGMQKFTLKKEINQPRTARSFYINFYPYLDDKKNLSISSEIFSQYNCVTPVVKNFDENLVTGKWKNRAALFELAGRFVETQILALMANSTIGDAFQSLEKGMVIKTWEELNLALVRKSNTVETNEISKLPLSQSWEVDMEAQGKDPILIFSFLPPLDNYAGEVKVLSGNFALNENLGTQGAKGDFVAKIADVTMGAEDFDHAVQNKMLKMDLFPDSRFTFAVTKGLEGPLHRIEGEEIEVRGFFTLLGKEIPLKINATIKPIWRNGGLRLEVKSSFLLPLFKSFKVEGPDGPSPAKDELQFFMKFYMKSN